MPLEKYKILLVEDERDIAFILSSIFKKEGYQISVATTGETGLKMARSFRPDIIISDIMLPQMDGLEMVRIIRQTNNVPVLFLTAKRAEADHIAGFKLGADDYISKPFSTRELVCRVKAVLRRASTKPAAKTKAVGVGGIEIDADRREVRVNGKFRKISPREFQLLQILLQAEGKVLSRDYLLNRVWGYDEGMKISTRTVDQHIARLRRNLGSEKRRLCTVKNFGYKFKN